MNSIYNESLRYSLDKATTKMEKKSVSFFSHREDIYYDFLVGLQAERALMTTTHAVSRGYDELIREYTSVSGNPLVDTLNSEVHKFIVSGFRSNFSMLEHLIAKRVNKKHANILHEHLATIWAEVLVYSRANRAYLSFTETETKKLFNFFDSSFKDLKLYLKKIQ